MRRAAIIAMYLLVAETVAAQTPPAPSGEMAESISGPVSGPSIAAPVIVDPSSVFGAAAADNPPPAASDLPQSLEILPASDPHLVSLDANAAELPDVLRMIAQNHGLNLVIGPGVSGQVTLSVENARLEEILDAILGVSGYAWHRRGNLLYVTRLNASQRVEASVQGRMLRIFALNYMSAADAQGVATGLLSPVGQAFVSEADPADKNRTRELLVVEDVPDAVARIEAYLAQVDHPPRQVLIESHVLQVTLDNENRHGINLTQLLRLGNASLTVESLRHGSAEAGAGDDGGILAPSDGMLITLKGHDITGLVELIQSNTDARTLASPKVLVANRQKANIQIGQRLGYKTTTTTQTSSLETINFLDTGVVLDVIPVISDDGQILMTITPKVSNGRVVDELPEEDTTELTTTVLLPDGGGVVMGGLIKEEDSNTISKVPWFGDIPYVGALFRRKLQTNRRTEIIIALVTRVVPTVEEIRQHELHELYRALPPHAAADLQSSKMMPPQFIPPELFGVEVVAPPAECPPDATEPATDDAVAADPTE